LHLPFAQDSPLRKSLQADFSGSSLASGAS